MTHRQLKAGYFTLAGLNTLAACYYSNYLFFFLRDRFGFGNRENLWVTALHGFIYVFAAVQCGKFAQRRGYLTSLKIGYVGLTLVMVAGALLDGLTAQLLVLAAYSVVLLFTWPALEAVTTERESQVGTLQMVGVYNCTWAGTAALAYFTGGRIYDAFGKGAIYWLPGAIFLIQIPLLLWLEKHHAAALAATPEPPRETPHTPEASALQQPVSPKSFLKMAWLANPFAYIAINTLVAVMPGIARKLDLSPTQVGLFCSLWLFGRFGAFVLLWQWSGWHYRFRWLLGSFLLLIISFAAILLASHLWIVVVAQVFFGLATGLIYYSSLFYSMDASDEKGAHGGVHEAFIGAGICLGPAVGAAALQFGPHVANAGAWAVTGLLGVGLGGLLWFRFGRGHHNR